MDDTLLFLLCGLHSLGFAVFHIFFWKLLRWKTELAKLGVTNRGVMQIMNVQLILLFLAVGVACFWFGESLNDQQAGRFFLAAISVFWLVRLVQQFIFLRQNHWAMHVLSSLFLAGVALFGWAAFV